MQDWFKKDTNFDNNIKLRFQNDYTKAIRNELEDWQDEPKECLALIILLDQFSRNIYREQPEAYQYDYKARLITLN